jgi:tRNA (pseudouridine54-N1)-methyltransferase
MREFVYFSQSARTSGNFDSGELMKAGRMDIAIHSFIQGVFLSHGFRKDTVFHFVFYGQPDPPKHIEIQIKDDLDISKKDVGNLIKKILYKFKEGRKTEVFPGCFVERKSFLKLIEEMGKDGKEIFILDKKGEDIRKAKIGNDCVFILGDQEGLPKKEMRRLKEITTSVSVGDKMYFASQTVAVVNNELDYRGI